MSKTISTNKLSLIFIFLVAFSFQSCKTTRSLVKDSFEPGAPEDAHFILAHDIVFPEIEGTYKYIFFRLYNPSYKNPLYIANILKNGISLTKTEDVPDLSHASMNFTLDDNYYGLTLGGEYQLAEEECALPQNNKYMKNCDPTKSEQITYALKVSEEEYQKTKDFVTKYVQSTDINYASSLNFKIALFNGYCHVDVGVVLAVVLAVPCFGVVAASNDICWRGGNPFAVVCFKDGVALRTVVVDDHEKPWLTVASRGGEAGGIDHGCKHVAFNGYGFIVAAGVARCREFVETWV